MNALRVLAAIFDIDTAKAETKLEKLESGLENTKQVLASVAGAVVGAFAIDKLQDFIEEQIEAGSVVNDTAARLGVSTDALQRFQYAAGLAGVGSEQAATALGFLNKNLGEAITGNEDAAKTFRELGIHIGDVANGSASAADLLPSLAEKFAGLGSDAERTALSMKLFGKSGAALIPLLKQGGPELERLSKEFDILGGGMQENFIEIADQAGDEIDKFKFALQGLKSRIAVEILPSVTEFAKTLQRVATFAIRLTKETYIVKEGLAVLGVVGAAAAAKTAVGWAKFFGIFPKGNAGIVKTLASLGWIGVAIGLVAVLGLLFEDLWVGINGGESVIRDWITEALGVEEANLLFEQFRTTFANLGDMISGMTPSFGELGSMLGSIAKTAGEIVVNPYFVKGLEVVLRLLGSIVTAFIAVGRAQANMVIGDWKGAVKALTSAVPAIAGKDGFFGSDARNRIFSEPGSVGGHEGPVAQLRAPAIDAPRPTIDVPRLPAHSSPAGDTNVDVGGINVNVQGGATNAETGQAVARAVKDVFQNDLQAAHAGLAKGAM